MKHGRWLELVKEYEYDIWYHLGKANVVADALRRRMTLSQITTYQELQKEIKNDQIKLLTGMLIELKI